jgi:hypothetical protein
MVKPLTPFLPHIYSTATHHPAGDWEARGRTVVSGESGSKATAVRQRRERQIRERARYTSEPRRCEPRGIDGNGWYGTWAWQHALSTNGALAAVEFSDT